MPYPYQTFVNSDHSVLVEFQASPNENLLRHILGVAQTIEQAELSGFIELVTAYNSILVIFDPLRFVPDNCLASISRLVEHAQSLSGDHRKLIEIPVCYDPKVAPDIEDVAEHCHISTKELIQLHTANEYTVFMLGFLPGFLYLGGLNPKLHCPRKSTPRTRIEPGSVGIGGEQTGIYPVASPGGWHIIGRTPLPMLNLQATPPAIAQPLDRIRFKAISYQQYQQWESKA